MGFPFDRVDPIVESCSGGEIPRGDRTLSLAVLRECIRRYIPTQPPNAGEISARARDRMPAVRSSEWPARRLKTPGPEDGSPRGHHVGEGELETRQKHQEDDAPTEASYP